MRDVLSYISTRKVKRVLLMISVAAVLLWIGWRRIFPRKVPTSAVGCKNRLAEVKL